MLIFFWSSSAPNPSYTRTFYARPIVRTFYAPPRTTAT